VVIPEEVSVFTRLLFVFSVGVIAAAQPSSSGFPMYDASTGNPKIGLPPSDDLARPVSARPGHWQNQDPPESGEFSLSPNPSGAGPVSADQLRHPLTGKALRSIKKAESLIAAHDYVHAQEELQKAAKDQAAAPYAHSLLGQEYVRSFQFGEAVTELQQAIRSLPSSVPDHANLGYALLMTGQAGAAEKELRRALELQPSNPRTHLVLGMLYYSYGSRDREAEEHLEFAARELPGAHLMLAKFYRNTGRVDASEREFQAYVRSIGSADPGLARQWFENGGRSAALR
jgi:tetratricopeptide (TPR) repeat protein